MLNSRYESLFSRFAAARAPCDRRRTEPDRDRRNLCRLSPHHQTLSQTTTRDWPCLAKSDPRSACQKRSGLAGPLESPIRGPSRRDARRALPPVPSRTWCRGEHRQHQPCQSCSGVDAKKKTLRASEQNDAARATWREQMKQLLSQDLVFVDETGSHIAMTPLYAYAPRGQRAIGKVPRNYGAIMTLLASSLKPGQVVILDNLSIHQGSRVRQAIEARGCRLLFLPAYSPDFSPIEEAFSKLKTLLRRAGARTREALQEAIATALDLITETDACGWFTHCGYPPSRSTETVQEL